MKSKDKSHHILVATLIGGTLLIGGCASPYGGQGYGGASNAPQQYAPANQQAYQQPNQPSYNNGRGVVEAIDVIDGGSKSSGIGGALVGGLVGGVLGHQI